ncbi:MAG TPA: fibronectin type III domain-containing protein [archaeon]|nr:fibronectin type III domain-containing protein [archaeon]
MKNKTKILAVFSLALLVSIISVAFVLGCGFECSTNEDCGSSQCSENYQDYCDGAKLVDYNDNGIFDYITVQNSCGNTCQDGFCIKCTPDCSAPVVSGQCALGACGAECDASNGCEPKIEGSTCYYGDGCNLETCSCSYSQDEFCPEPGTISDGYCYYGQRSCSSEGCSLNVAPMNGYTTCDPTDGPGEPEQPVDNENPVPPVVQASVNGNSITLTWSGASDNVGIGYYIVYRSTDTSFVPISGNIDPSQNSFTNPGLQYSTTYYYIVGVFDTSGNSANSSSIGVTTGSETQPQPQPSPMSGDISIGGGNSGTINCTPDWSCSLWGNCQSDGTQARTCVDLHNCGNITTKPNETQTCSYTPAPTCQENWLCSDWSNCVDGERKRTCTDLNSCNTTLSKPAETESCEGSVPSAITGMVAALFLNPALAFILILVILAILTYIWKVIASRKKESKK